MDIKRRFNKAYHDWQNFIKQPNISTSSNSELYTNNKPYIEIIKIGKPAIPLLVNKIEKGKSSGWKEGQFFLWYAVKEITGVDLSNHETVESEQEIAVKYINWFKEQNVK